MFLVYFDELKSANPGSYVHLDVGEDEKSRRCFFYFPGMFGGIQPSHAHDHGGRYFLKGTPQGCLLSVVAKDGDEGMILYFRWMFACYCRMCYIILCSNGLYLLCVFRLLCLL